jgi:hypothetical protein
LRKFILRVSSKCFVLCVIHIDSKKDNERLIRNSAMSALKQCKACQTTVNRVVSLRCNALFHKLINTCVGNLTIQKYFAKISA